MNSAPRALRLAKGVAAAGTAWGLLVLALAAATEASPENWATFMAITASGLYTLALYLARPVWKPWLARRPLPGATLLGILNAAVVEALFVLFERLMGARGVAAHPNLLLDLLLTMPWYGLMVASFVRVQRRQRFPWAVVLLLGAVYELGADGVVPQVLGLLSGDSQLLSPAYWLQLALFAFWTFIPVYSSMVLVPAWLIDGTPPAPGPSPPAWLDALKPLVWLLPFTAYVAVLLLLLSNLQPA